MRQIILKLIVPKSRVNIGTVREKKTEMKFPRNVAECTLGNIRDIRTRKVLYNFFLFLYRASSNM
jgi:hypothetical protein